MVNLLNFLFSRKPLNKVEKICD